MREELQVTTKGGKGGGGNVKNKLDKIIDKINKDVITKINQMKASNFGKDIVDNSTNLGDEVLDNGLTILQTVDNSLNETSDLSNSLNTDYTNVLNSLNKIT